MPSSLGLCLALWLRCTGALILMLVFVNVCLLVFLVGWLVCAFRCGLCGFADGGVGVVDVACCCGVASLWLLLFCGLFDFRCGLGL